MTDQLLFFHWQHISNMLSAVVDLNYILLSPEAERQKRLLQYPIDKIKSLKRCNKCILPETFPFIDFDKDEICNYCNNYIVQGKNKSINELMKLVGPYRKNGGYQALLANIGMEYRTEEKGHYYFGTSLHRPWKAIGKVSPEYDDKTNIFNDDTEFSLDLLGNFVTIDFRYFFAE